MYLYYIIKLSLHYLSPLTYPRKSILLRLKTTVIIYSLHNKARHKDRPYLPVHNGIEKDIYCIIWHLTCVRVCVCFFFHCRMSYRHRGKNPKKKRKGEKRVNKLGTVVPDKANDFVHILRLLTEPPTLETVLGSCMQLFSDYFWQQRGDNTGLPPKYCVYYRLV